MPRRLFSLVLTLLLFVVPMVSSGPPFQYAHTFSVDSTGTTVSFTDTETGAAFSPSYIWVRNKSTSANEVYISATTYTVTATTSYMALEPGEWASIPPVFSALEPGRVSIGLRCATAETATVQVWGLR